MTVVWRVKTKRVKYGGCLNATILPFSSTAQMDVLPTETCFNFCLGGEGMWYQHSPAGGDKPHTRLAPSEHSHLSLYHTKTMNTHAFSRPNFACTRWANHPHPLLDWPAGLVLDTEPLKKAEPSLAMAHTWLAPPMETDLKAWSVPTCSHDDPWETSTRQVVLRN